MPFIAISLCGAGVPPADFRAGETPAPAKCLPKSPVEIDPDHGNDAPTRTSVADTRAAHGPRHTASGCEDSTCKEQCAADPAAAVSNDHNHDADDIDRLRNRADIEEVQLGDAGRIVPLNSTPKNDAVMTTSAEQAEQARRDSSPASRKSPQAPSP